MARRATCTTCLALTIAMLSLTACGGEAKPEDVTSDRANLKADAPEMPVNPNSWVFGIEPAKNLAIIEDHSDALLYWLAEGFSKRTVLHIDTHDDSRLVDSGSVAHLRDLAESKDFSTLKEKSGVAFSTGGKIFNIGNFLHAGYLLGVVSEVIWVLPAEPNNLTNINMVRGYLEQVGFDRTSAQSFRIEKGVIRGNRAGMPMVVCSSKQIPKLDETVLVSLDIDYLMGKHQDPISSPMLRATLDLFSQMTAANIKTDHVLVSYSVHGGSIPVMHKYTGDYLADLIRHPEMLDKDLPQVWVQRDLLLQTRARGDLEQALEMAEVLIGLDPLNASLHMEQAFARLQGGDAAGAIASMNRAAELDPSYLLGFLELAMVVKQSPTFSELQRKAVTDMIFSAAGSFFTPTDGVENHVQASARFFEQDEIRRAQIELFRLVEESASEQLHGFKPGS